MPMVIATKPFVTRELIAAGADEIMVICQLGTVSHEVSMETIRQWGEYVIPVIRAEQENLVSARN